MTPLLGAATALPAWAWVAFFALIAGLLAIDLGVFQRTPHAVKVKEALVWCGVWVTLALAFAAVVWWWRGAEAGQQFLSAYLVELCLSVDNVFVFILIFAYFRVEARYQHRVLFWGILGAIAMRTVFILVGVGIIARFHWVLYLFGAFLVYTGVKMALPGGGEADVHPERNRVVQLFRRFFPVSAEPHGKYFFTRSEGRFAATPLFVVLLVVETSDVVFALDSLPAVLAITKSGFIALTSNVFAILGLRSLYFALSGVMQLFRFLKFGLAVILTFIGVKMLIEHWLAISTTLSLLVIGAVLVVSIVASLVFPAPAEPPSAPSGTPPS